MTQARGGSDVRMPLVIGAIGHRDLVDSEIDGLGERVRTFLDSLQRKYPDLRLTILTSLADGADRLVADAAVALGVPVAYVLPMPSALYEHDFDVVSLREYRDILDASDVLTLPLVNGNTADDVTHPGAARDLQYAQLGAFIAAHCHILLALWDGNEDGPSGGTATVIRFHQDDFMPGLSDGEPRSRLDDTDDESDLVYHVVCSRDRPDGAPMAPLEVGETWWLSRSERAPRTAEMPKRYEIVMQRMAEFSRDQLRHHDTIARAANALLPTGLQFDLTDGDRTIAGLFGVADWLARRYQRLFLNALKFVCAFALVASLCFIGYGDLPGQEMMTIMIYPYLLFMAASIGTYLIARRGAWQRRYVDYRVLAEALRVQFYWAIARVERPALSRFGHDAFLKRHDLELGWIRNILRVSGRQGDAAGSAASDSGIDVAIQDWIEDERRGQLHYYRNRWPQLLKQHRFTEALGRISLAGGVALAAWLAFGQFFFNRLPTDTLIALMGLLPVVAAIRQAYAYRIAEHELINQFQFMDRIFANAQRQLRRTTTARERRRILFELGDAAMREHGQWIMRQRERPISTVG
jgi:hypothetical protein